MTGDALAACLAEHATRGPRYTSYPPATELRAIAPDLAVAELARITEPAALYVHVPFCRSLCAYCGCNVIPTRDTSRGDAYVDTLATELALVAGAVATRLALAEIALGGGSPNFLQPPAIRRLVATIDRYFAPLPGARRSVELDPRSTTSSQVEAFAAGGFRSLSVGVQDFDERVQDAIRRHQTIAQTRWLVERARAAGFDDVNVDLVYGLPRQTEATFAATLDAIVALAPDRIALFGYAHLPGKLPHQKLVERAGRVLDSYERATLLVAAIDRLTGAGYRHLGLDHFARPGSKLAQAADERRMVRTFQGYVERRADAIIGVGVSAISTTPNAFWQNHAELAPWRDAIERGELPVARGVALDADDRLRRAVIGALMCDGEVDLAAIGDVHGVDATTYFADELARVAAEHELARIDGARVVTTPLGRLLVRNVCMIFDRYHRPEPAGFSPTI